MFIILFSENDGVTIGFGEALHSRKLMTAGDVYDLSLVIILFGRNDVVTFRYGKALHGRGTGGCQ